MRGNPPGTPPIHTEFDSPVYWTFACTRLWAAFREAENYIAIVKATREHGVYGTHDLS
jgi:hypothetical protein